jgi:hypothetical protein
MWGGWVLLRGFCGRARALRWSMGSSRCVGAVARVAVWRIFITIRIQKTFPVQYLRGPLHSTEPVCSDYATYQVRLPAPERLCRV